MKTETSELSLEERLALEQFRDLEITLEEFRSRLARRVTFNFEGSAMYTRGINKMTAPADPAVPVTLEQVRQAHRTWTTGGVTERQLSDWASMLLMNDDYEFLEAEQELIAEWLNTVSIPGESIPSPDPC